MGARVPIRVLESDRRQPALTRNRITKNTSFPRERTIAARYYINALRTNVLHFLPLAHPLSPFTFSHAFTHTYIFSCTRSFSPFLSLSHTISLSLSLPLSLSIRSLSCGRSLMVDVVKRFGVAWEFETRRPPKVHVVDSDNLCFPLSPYPGSFGTSAGEPLATIS